MSSSGCRGRAAVALEECVGAPWSCSLMGVDRASGKLGLSIMELICESLVQCPCPLPASPLPWGGTTLTWVSSLSETLGAGKVSKGIIHCPSQCLCAEQCWAGSTSSFVPVGYNGLWVQHVPGHGW